MRSVQIMEGHSNTILGHRVELLQITFDNGYVGHIMACQEAAFFTDPASKRHPVWLMRVEACKVWLTGGNVSSDSVKISDASGKELAHETVSGWPLVAG